MDSFKLTIRQGHLNDLTDLQNLFVETISTICKTDYNEEQIKVWTSSVEKKDRWLDILTNQYLLVAEDKEKIIGFCSLDKGNYLDLLYVHKDFQRQGIANKLFVEIENEAKRQGQIILTSDVSKTARPFFEKVGFEIITEQTVEIQGINLTNFKMTKKIA